ncbi:uncharacterized protein LODBEIA_P18100 [Lodderomyces beijingensis]|uniref:K Homology domain-containing protein n=1 Tax=Lodderomyces beijingensis TaxID=1775926 RepID=A0ABP0ZHE4_9ASCO
MISIDSLLAEGDHFGFDLKRLQPAATDPLCESVTPPPPTLYCSTGSLVEVLRQVKEELHPISLEIDPECECDIRIDRVSLHSRWEVRFVSPRRGVRAAAAMKLFVHYLLEKDKCITVKGNLEDAFQLHGRYKNGTVEFTRSGADMMWWSQKPIKRESDDFSVVPIESAGPLQTLKRCGKETESKTEQGAKTQKMETVMLQFNQQEVSQIIGRGGSRLNSIRIQSKCWINVLPPRRDDTRHFLVTGQKNVKQDIVVSGFVGNVKIAIDEIGRIVGDTRTVW